MKPLTLLKIIGAISGRYVPKWYHRLQQHLTDCAAYEILDRGLKPWLPPLTHRHVLGLDPLPDKTAPPGNIARFTTYRP